MEPKSFTNVDDNALVDAIRLARNRIVLIAPGLRVPVADALIQAMDQQPALNVTAILDLDAEVCRLGYGDFAGMKKLDNAMRARQRMLQHQPGIRLGVLLADELFLVYAPTPLLIEAGSAQPRKPNAIRIETRTDGLTTLQDACGAGKDAASQEVGLEPGRGKQHRLRLSLPLRPVLSGLMATSGAVGFTLGGREVHHRGCSSS